MNHVIAPSTFDGFSEAFKQLAQFVFELGNHLLPLCVYDYCVIEKLPEIPVDKAVEEALLV